MVKRITTLSFVFLIGFAFGYLGGSCSRNDERTRIDVRNLVTSMQATYRIYADSNALKPDFSREQLDTYRQTIKNRLGVSFKFDPANARGLRMLGGYMVPYDNAASALTVFIRNGNRICLIALPKGRLPGGANRIIRNAAIPLEIRSFVGYRVALIGKIDKEDKDFLFAAISANQ